MGEVFAHWIGHAVLSAVILAGLLAARRFPAIYALLLWPGTAAHELLHYLVGKLTFAAPQGISLVPRREADTWIIGEVRFARLRWWNALPISLAPLLLLPIAAGAWWLSIDFAPQSVPSLLLKWLALQGFLSAWPSRVDWRMAAKSATILVIVLVVLPWWLGRF